MTNNADNIQKINSLMVKYGVSYAEQAERIEEALPPSLLQMTRAFGGSLLGFAGSGFPIPDPETFNARLDTCKGCEFWDESGFVNTGRCKKCGCSTQAKLRMATEKCPIGKW